MAAGIDWFRWHHGSVTDPKFQLVARRAGASLPDVIAIWAALLETASQSSPRGSIESFDPEAYDVLFNFPEPRSADVLAALAERGLLKGAKLVAWEKRQPKREREADDSTDRVRKHRDRKKESSGVTPRNANETQETPRGEKSREDLKASLSLDADADAGEGEGGVVVTDGDGNPQPPRDGAQAIGVGVPAAKRLRAMGLRVTGLNPTLLALCAEKFSVEEMALLSAELVLRKASLWDDPDVHPDLPELLASAATQQQMLLTPDQYAAIQAAAADVGINYLATALRGRRQDAIDKQSPSRKPAKNSARKPSATDNFEGKTYVGTSNDKLPPELLAAVEGC